MQGGDGDDTLNGLDGNVEDDMSGDEGDDLCSPRMTTTTSTTAKPDRRPVSSSGSPPSE